MNRRRSLFVGSLLSLFLFCEPAVLHQVLQAQTSSGKVPDLSGDWGLDTKRGGIGQSISAADPGGKMRGKEPDISYQPWALQKMM